MFEVLATSGDSALGGDDFDHRLYCWVLEQARPVAIVGQRHPPAAHPRPRRQRNAVTDAPEAPIQATLSDGQLVQLTLTLETFEHITRICWWTNPAPVRKALRDARLSVEDIQGVVMVGGATRMPHIRKAVASFSASRR